MTVAVIASLYGDYDCFVDDWHRSIASLNRRPDEVILRRGAVPSELYPQPRLLNEAIAQATSDWIWNLNVDDTALPDGLDGIDDVDADVWLMGYRRRDGQEHVPAVISNSDYIALNDNSYPAMSCFRRSALNKVGGFPVIGYEDWGLFRRLARAGCVFAASGRVNSIYSRHDGQRSAVELPTKIGFYMAEMMEDA